MRRVGMRPIVVEILFFMVSSMVLLPYVMGSLVFIVLLVSSMVLIRFLCYVRERAGEREREKDVER